MDPLTFSLKPFEDKVPGSRPAIAGSIGRRLDTLSLRCEIRGDLSALSIPRRADAPARRDRLWEETCFEIFLGAAGSAEYWEFNLSPAGHWNVYRFESYREAMREEAAFGSLPFDVRADSRLLRLSLDVDVGAIVPAGTAAEAAVCAVVRTVAGDTSHWAAAHPGSRPDFHRRDGFTIALPAST